MTDDFKFTTNYSNNDNQNTNEPLPKGTYECVINTVQESATPSGAESIHFDLIVRNDLDQALPNTNSKQHNRHLFLDEWRRKATNQYDMKHINMFMEAAGIPNGTSINSFENFCQMMEGKPVRLDVNVINDNYNGINNKKNDVAPWGWHKTQFPQVQHQWKNSKMAPQSDPFSSQATDLNYKVEDTDLPF